MTPGDKVAFDHQRLNRRGSQVLHDRVRYFDLPGGVLVAVTVAAVHHEDLGKVSRAKQANGAFHGGGIEVWSGLAAAAKHDMRIGVARGFQNAPITHGQRITDACLGFEETKALLYRPAEPCSARAVRPAFATDSFSANPPGVRRRSNSTVNFNP